MTVDLTTLESWRGAVAAAYQAKADALEDALVGLDAVLPLIPESRVREVRDVMATLRDAINDARDAIENGAP